MRRTLSALLCVFALGCGATYSVVRVGADGSRLEASARTNEKAESIQFTFDGDPDGQMTVTLEKRNVEPAILPQDILQSIIAGLKK